MPLLGTYSTQPNVSPREELALSSARQCSASLDDSRLPGAVAVEKLDTPVLYLSTNARPSRPSPLPTPAKKNLTTLQQPTPPPNPPPDLALFTSNPPLFSPEPGNNKPPDERKVKLGKTLRILQSHLPTLLQSPLPQQILSPHITLHLFPSTHPHLPTVSGRVAYIAALWSSPIAWNRVPLVGNVRLEILSERMVDGGAGAGAGPVYLSSGGDGRRPEGACGEQLIVRWRTVGKGGWLGGLRLGSGGACCEGEGERGVLRRGKGSGGGGQGKEGVRGNAGEEGEGEVKAPVGMAQAVGASNKEFTGLFILTLTARAGF
ncbi:hypothetical protein NEMBOFW57_009798 [Staphylotrichum longicolle]|uniref:Uncharacterized protein n=1 Tax=Staphylotrichum longicolle TaxID=669026 RepID=A0AAD4EPN0_9PEZI|nr:hypothetical protein NEMBOFW57_009798 [Staphylotrichum longicolle]